MRFLFLLVAALSMVACSEDPLLKITINQPDDDGDTTIPGGGELSLLAVCDHEQLNIWDSASQSRVGMESTDKGFAAQISAPGETSQVTLSFDDGSAVVSDCQIYIDDVEVCTDGSPEVLVTFPLEEQECKRKVQITTADFLGVASLEEGYAACKDADILDRLKSVGDKLKYVSCNLDELQLPGRADALEEFIDDMPYVYLAAYVNTVEMFENENNRTWIDGNFEDIQDDHSEFILENEDGDECAFVWKSGSIKMCMMDVSNDEYHTFINDRIDDLLSYDEYKGLYDEVHLDRVEYDVTWYFQEDLQTAYFQPPAIGFDDPWAYNDDFVEGMHYMIKDLKLQVDVNVGGRAKYHPMVQDLDSWTWEDALYYGNGLTGTVYEMRRKLEENPDAKCVVNNHYDASRTHMDEETFEATAHGVAWAFECASSYDRGPTGHGDMEWSTWVEVTPDHVVSHDYPYYQLLSVRDVELEDGECYSLKKGSEGDKLEIFFSIVGGDHRSSRMSGAVNNDNSSSDDVPYWQVGYRHEWLESDDEEICFDGEGTLVLDVDIEEYDEDAYGTVVFDNDLVWYYNIGHDVVRLPSGDRLLPGESTLVEE
jgi:hypothetical protein